MASPPHTRLPKDEVAAAAERRVQTSPRTSHLSELELHEKRQHFRRLIDPGILRPNAKDVALSSLETLLAMAENILKEPENPKYQQFKPTNNLVKRRLIDPKGALEYAIALGFRPEVRDLQPYYVFNPRHLADTQIGCAILKEAFDLESEKQKRAGRAKREAEVARLAAARNVKLAFIDDRKSKQLADQRETELRKARATFQSEHMTTPAPVTDARNMPGPGYTLSGDVMEDDVHNEDEEESLQLNVPGGPPPQMPGPGHVLGDYRDPNIL